MKQARSSVSPPLIEGAQAVPDTILPFEFSTLHWQSAGAMEVEISGIDGKQPANGSIVVSPEATTTYIIKAIGPTGVDEMKVTVNLNSRVIVTRPVVRHLIWCKDPSAVWLFHQPVVADPALQSIQ